MKLITNMKILKCQNLSNWRTANHGVPRQGIMMSSQALFESDKQVISWCYKVRTVGWMWHYCPSKTYDGLCGTHLCVALHYHRGVTHCRYFVRWTLRTWAFRLLCISIQQLDFTAVPIHKIKRITHFSS